MLTITCDFGENLDFWPTIFFASDDNSLLDSFCSFTNTINVYDWKLSFEFNYSSLRKRKEYDYYYGAVDVMMKFPTFWWRAFSDTDVGAIGNSDDESNLSKQELIDMCEFNIKSGHAFKCDFAAKTYLWLCENRSKIGNITLKFI